jgi:hypothetical protein
MHLLVEVLLWNDLHKPVFIVVEHKFTGNHSKCLHRPFISVNREPFRKLVSLLKTGESVVNCAPVQTDVR